MRTNLIVFTTLIAAACSKPSDKPAATKGTTTAPSPTTAAAKPATPPPAVAKPGFTATLSDGTKVGPLTFDHQIITDDGQGNHMALLIANCPQITDSCSIGKYLRENQELLDQQCPAWAEIAITFQAKDRHANMGPVTVPTGAFTSSGDQPMAIGMVEYSETKSAHAYATMQVHNDKATMVEVTRADAKGLAGKITARSESGSTAIEGTFDARACTCDQNTGVCS